MGLVSPRLVSLCCCVCQAGYPLGILMRGKRLLSAYPPICSRVCLAIVLGLQRLSGATASHSLFLARRVLFCKLGEINLPLVDLATQFVQSLCPVGAVRGEVVQGFEGELDILWDG